MLTGPHPQDCELTRDVVPSSLHVLNYCQVQYKPDDLCCQQAREGEFRVPHQEQSNLDPYSNPQSREEEVRYPTIGKRKPAAAKVSLANILMGE